MALILPVKFVQSGNLPPEWRSGVAAEDQHHWAVLLGKRRKPDGVVFVELREREIRRHVPDVQGSGSRLCPCSFKGKIMKASGTGIVAMTRPKCSGV